MSIVLTRIDDRLIHGQVVVGWVQARSVKRIVLVDDEVRANTWEQELYSVGVPGSLELLFVSVDEAVERIDEWSDDDVRTLLLAGNVKTIARLCAATDRITQVNVGGLHDASSRSQRLAYVYLTDAEVKELRALVDRGVQVLAQDVPTAKPAPLEDWA